VAKDFLMPQPVSNGETTDLNFTLVFNIAALSYQLQNYG
jgi:hypothetical protein